jgi:hypothetical protein
MAVNDNSEVQPDGPMRLHVFQSRAKNGLRAFTGDLAGCKLPTKK